MPRLMYTVENMAEEVRYGIDEENSDALDTDLDILPALNRAQDYAFNIYARKYPEPILQYQTLTLTGGVAEYEIPESVFEDRILKIEIEIPQSGSNTYLDVRRISYMDVTEYESSVRTATPQYYAVIGRNIRFIATPSGTYSARIWYLRNPEKLVLPQGRITVVNPTSNYLVVEGIGTGLTTQSDSLTSYVNVVDGQTGIVKGTFQIGSISTDRVTFRSTPSRSTVLNRTILGEIPSTVSADDYICQVDGICVPYFGRPTSNFIIQYALAEITSKLGGDRLVMEEVLKKFEKQIERDWAGREQQMRVRKKSGKWGSNTRRFYWDI